MWFINNAINGLLILVFGTILFVVIEFYFDFPWGSAIGVGILVIIGMSAIRNLRRSLMGTMALLSLVFLSQILLAQPLEMATIIAMISLMLGLAGYQWLCNTAAKKFKNYQLRKSTKVFR